MSMSHMDQDRLKLDLEYITLARALAEGESLGTVLARLDAYAKTPDLPDPFPTTTCEDETWAWHVSK